jgi:hypothetical protein
MRRSFVLSRPRLGFPTPVLSPSPRVHACSGWRLERLCVQYLDCTLTLSALAALPSLCHLDVSIAGNQGAFETVGWPSILQLTQLTSLVSPRGFAGSKGKGAAWQAHSRLQRLHARLRCPPRPRPAPPS